MKRFVHYLIDKAGYRLTKYQPTAKSWQMESGELRFGPYHIETGVSPFIQIYRENPANNAMLERLAKAVIEHHPNAAMIDVGANYGDTIAIAKCGAEMPVLAIEGDSSIFQILQNNCRQFSDVDLVNAFVGEIEDTIEASVDKAGWNSTVKPGSDLNGVTLSMRTVDTIWSEWKHRTKVKLLKCDVEGFDVRAIFGARKTLESAAPVVLFEYNREAMMPINEDGLRVFPLFRDLGYETLMFYDAFGRFLLSGSVRNDDLIHDLHDYADGACGKVYYYDVICFHASDADLVNAFQKSERNVRRD